MRIDFSPLYRSTIGFDRLFDMLDQTARGDTPNWPPYNIERTGEDNYRITMALAGFAPDEIELVQKESTLFVAGHKNPDHSTRRGQVRVVDRAKLEAVAGDSYSLPEADEP
jgi:HSP20 family molecular chaperone IbpA